MKDYSSMSDFEINVAVFEAIHNGSPEFKEGENGAMIALSFEGDVIGGNSVEAEVQRSEFNPCNNPADAWPIITVNLIGVEPIYKNGTKWLAHAGDDSEFRCVEASGLRAAMAVYLMMKDAEKSHG